MVSSRWVLGLDCVSTCPGAALWRDGEVAVVRTRADGNTVPVGRPGDRLIGCLLGVLETAGIGVNDLSGVAVTVGPGSFTGIRVGLALVHGLLQGTSIACAAVETCEAARLAEDLEMRHPDHARRGTGSASSPAVVLVQLRKTDWFVQQAAGDEPDLASAADATSAVLGRRVLSIGAPPTGVSPEPLPGGLAAAAAMLGGERLGALGWTTMDTPQRVRILKPEYRRETYVKETRPA